MKLKIKKANKEDLFFCAVILIFSLCALNKYLTYVGILTVTGIFFVFALKYVPTKDIMLPKLILFLLLFQNFCIGIGAHVGGNFSGSIQLLTQIPTILILISAIHIFMTQQVTRRGLFIIYVLFIVSYFFKGNGHISTAIVYLRNFFVFYLAWIIGKNNIDTSEKKDKFLYFYVKMAMIAGVFGLVGVILGNEFFNMIGVREVYLGKGWKDLIQGTTPGNFRTLFFGQWVNRMASLYYEPVNFSYFIFLATIICLYTKRKLAFLFLFFCGMLTFGKGGIFVFGFTVLAVSFHTMLHVKFSKTNRKRIMLIMLLLLALVVAYISMFKSSDFGTYNHFYGFFSAIPVILNKPLGYGMGTAGNILRSYTQNGNYVATESAIATMGYQIGVPGVLMFFVLLCRMGTDVYLNRGREKGSRNYELCIAASYLPFILFLVSVFQENTISPQAVVPYMLVVGAFGTQYSARREASINNNLNA